MLDLIGLPSPHWCNRPKKIVKHMISDVNFECDECGANIESLRIMQLHVAYSHKRFASGNSCLNPEGVCLACLNVYHTPFRPKCHLQLTKQGLTKCQPTIAANCVPFHTSVDVDSCFKKAGARDPNALTAKNDTANAKAPIILAEGPLWEVVDTEVPKRVAPTQLDRIDDIEATQIDPHRVLAQLVMQPLLTCVVMVACRTWGR